MEEGSGVPEHEQEIRCGPGPLVSGGTYVLVWCGSGVCVCVCCGGVCVVVVVAVWCSGCVLGAGPKVLSSSPTLAIFHLIFHLPPTSPTSPPSCD